MPAGVLKLCRDPYGRLQHPIHISETVALSSPAQPRKPFLCGACEQILSTQGEAEVIPLLLKASGEFPLRDMLRTAAPLGRGRDSTPVYSARDNLGKLTDRIAHFMSGVFWRGSVTTWNLGSTESERNPLGRPYEEAMRRYLLGEAEFPNRCALVLEVASDEDLGPMVSFPVCKNQGGFHYHRFYVPGLDVALYVGNKIPNVLRLRRADGLLEVPIIVRSFQDGKLFKQMAKMAGRAEPKGILRRENNWDV